MEVVVHFVVHEITDHILF